MCVTIKGQLNNSLAISWKMPTYAGWYLSVIFHLQDGLHNWNAYMVRGELQLIIKQNTKRQTNDKFTSMKILTHVRRMQLQLKFENTAIILQIISFFSSSSSLLPHVGACSRFGA
jgi:hypothetical protein